MSKSDKRLLKNQAGTLPFFRGTKRDAMEKLGLENPVLPVESLNKIVDKSGWLPQMIETIVTNVHSRGYELRGVIEPEQSDAKEVVEEALKQKKARLAPRNGSYADLAKFVKVKEKEVEEEYDGLMTAIRAEKALVMGFLDRIFAEGSFTTLRERTGRELERTGNAYWEILRGKSGLPRQCQLLDAEEMFIGTEPTDQLEVVVTQRVTDIHFEKTKIRRRFHKYCQMGSDTEFVWFKELGCPLFMNSKTGTLAETEDELKAMEPDYTLATEVFHFSIPSAVQSSYGQPRWAGNLPAALGSRMVDEVNFDHFSRNAIPAMAIMVTGGALNKETVPQIKEFFQNEVKGAQNRNSVIVLEADSRQFNPNDTGKANIKIDFKNLRDYQLSDGQFTSYDKANMDKLRQSFRLPMSYLTGAEISKEDLRFAEEQVFGPLRDDFDEVFNTFILKAFGINTVSLRSRGTKIRDSQLMAQSAITGALNGVFTPNEARDLYGKAVQEEIPWRKEMWANQPTTLTAQAISVMSGPTGAVREQALADGKAVDPMGELFDELGIAAPESRPTAPDAKPEDKPADPSKDAPADPKDEEKDPEKLT